MEDSVAVDAKRILLRYGAPISVLDRIEDQDRIAFARDVSRTTLADRGTRVRELLVENGYVEADALPPVPKGRKRKASKN